MPLSRIEVCDFKSYRGHQIIGPFKNFTSVIGPNGAGKSNLMDAISFVLGVKSAQLRSSQLRDLIYRGRRLSQEDPDGEEQEAAEDDDGEGTAKKAWVLAVYQDNDGTIYNFQRTITPTGSSEYRINNKVVSYQSYNSTLENQNILVKAKNFLVFQGDVEAVASQSPKDLTKLIEQISGSLELGAEYEKAKAAQDRATENATFNFTKRRGIAGEIKQFREQKTEAQRFEKLRAERDALVVQKLLWKLFRIDETIRENVQKIISKNKELVELREQQAIHDAALTSAREEQAKARNETLKKEKAIKKQEKVLEKKRPDLVAIDAQIAHSKRKVENAQKMGDQVKAELLKREEDMARLTKDLEDLRKAANEASEAQRKASQQNFALTEESLLEYRKLRASANILAVDERQRLETLTREEKTQNRALVGIKEKYDQLFSAKEKLSSEVSVQAEKKSEFEGRVATHQADLAKARQELDNAQSERTRIAQMEAEINEKLQDVHNKLLQANVDQKESEREAKLKETFSNLQRLFPGVRGRVVDLCKPTQRKYETAVSVILGRNIDAVVVDHEKTAVDCIEYLRNQRAGQATFIPLDTIQVKPINDKFRTFAKGARLAVDVIEFDPAVERAMHHACGNALVCDTMEVARYVCYDKHQEVKAVTLEGTIIHKSGLITGGRSTHGANGGNGGRKWEVNEVEGLQRVRDQLLQQLKEINKTKPRGGGKADENLIAEISRLESALVLAKDDLSSTKLRLTGIRDELKHTEKELKKISPELEKSQSSHTALKTQIDDLRNTVDSAERTVFSSFCAKIGVSNIRAYEERQLQAAQAETDARMRFDNNIARQSHQLEFEKRQLSESQARLAKLESTAKSELDSLAKLQESKSSTQNTLDQLHAGIAQLQDELEELNEILEGKSKHLESVKKTTFKAAKKLDTVLKEVTLMNDEIDKLGSERAGIYRKCRLEEIELPLVAGSLNDVPMEENLREDVAMDLDQDEDATQKPRQAESYGIEVDFEDLDEDDRENPEAGAEFDASITKLTAEIEKMAPNMKAMDKLDDVEAKLAETEKEADKARKDSKLARDEFNTVKKRRCDLFNKAYNHISERIDQVYKDLTKGKAAPLGGVAYLGLEDSEEPYAGGIKYHAMPPMKRFRDMEQLSGGEKTVAALALLFAIHSYQPSPFFVLDEVDAALDNTNVAKIANYIRQQASDTFQFIVISLKGSLYEKGHSLVGIYRDQEMNSSKTLTLDLTHYDD